MQQAQQAGTGRPISYILLFYLGKCAGRLWALLFLPHKTANPKQRPRAKPLFNGGACVMTLRANALAMRGAFDPVELIDRHLSGDWGLASDSVKARNNRALQGGGKPRECLMSSYLATSGERVLVVTEIGRQTTTVMIPGEFGTLRNGK